MPETPLGCFERAMKLSALGGQSRSRGFLKHGSCSASTYTSAKPHTMTGLETEVPRLNSGGRHSLLS